MKTEVGRTEKVSAKKTVSVAKRHKRNTLFSAMASSPPDTPPDTSAAEDAPSGPVLSGGSHGGVLGSTLGRGSRARMMNNKADDGLAIGSKARARFAPPALGKEIGLYAGEGSGKDDAGRRTLQTNVHGTTAHEDFMRRIHEDIRFYGGSYARALQEKRQVERNDYDIIDEEHRFLWSERDAAEMTYEKRMAKKFDDQMFKEYCLADLSRYEEGRVAMRWRVEREVFEGKGQYYCGSIRCSERLGLQTWEVNFGYMEHGVKRNALVKVRLCPSCSRMLNHSKQHRSIAADEPVDDGGLKYLENGEPKKKSRKEHRRKRREDEEAVSNEG